MLQKQLALHTRFQCYNISLFITNSVDPSIYVIYRIVYFHLVFMYTFVTTLLDLDPQNEYRMG